MRLALLTNDYPPKPGGIQQYLGNLVDAWDGDVAVLAPHDGPAISTERGESVVHRHGPTAGPPRNFLWPTDAVGDWVERELGTFGPDAVLIGAPHPLTGLVRRIQDHLAVPVGVLAHGAEVTIPGAVPGLRSWLGSLLSQADVRFAVSRYTAGRVARVSGRSCRFVGAGVDLDVFSFVDRVPRERLVIGCVSRFVPRKRQSLVIDAAETLAGNGVACDVVLVGKGRLESALQRRADRAAVPVRLEVDVPWGRLAELYASFDVFCMPCRSRWGGLEVEGLGLVFLEASATGLPVLAGDSGGAPETVLPGETGFVVRTERDIVEAITVLSADEGLRMRMGRAGRGFVAAEFSWKRVVERFVEGFEAVRRGTPDLDT